ncbi:hypothetical protein HDV00_005719 [Rhizophlyctis rosea]|nr:hypothetical protein HDV00_005719 [Rhizophlyctis rosea]
MLHPHTHLLNYKIGQPNCKRVAQAGPLTIFSCRQGYTCTNMDPANLYIEYIITHTSEESNSWQAWACKFDTSAFKTKFGFVMANVAKWMRDEMVGMDVCESNDGQYVTVEPKTGNLDKEEKVLKRIVDRIEKEILATAFPVDCNIAVKTVDSGMRIC